MTATINASTTAGVVTTADTSGILQLQTNGTAALTVDASQNVGIGTSSPTNKLHVSSSSFETIKLQGTSTVSGINFVNSAYSNGYIYYDNGPNMLFYTNGSERARIDSSGNLLVGETAVDDSGGLAVIPGYATGAPALLAFNKGNSGSETCLRFKYQGTIVGTITYSSTATAYNTSSDYRLKNTIAPMTGALAKVALLKPVTYKWNVDGSDGQGFIAHELAEVVSGCVTGEKDATETVEVKDENGNVTGTEVRPVYQGIDTSFLVATLTAAIQELKAVVDAQAARITALEGAAA